MSVVLNAQGRCWLFLERLLLLAVVLLTWSQILQADTYNRTRSVRVDGCYCHCAGSRARGGCTKMCELPKYASRWWATSCAKPRQQPPVENPGAHPRLPHPDRAEHARI